MALNFDEQKNYFDSKYYVINLKYSKCEVDKAMAEFFNKKKVTPIIRAILHEHAHYIQCATTEVGYYLKMLDDYQMDHIKNMVNEASKGKLVCYPMMSNIMNNKNTRKKSQALKDITTHYYYWVLAEIVRQLILGDEKTIAYYLSKMMNGEGYLDYYLELDEALKCCLYEEKQEEKIKAEVEEELLIKIFTCAYAMQVVANLKISDLLESQALITEYFYDEVADERLIEFLSKKEMGKEIEKYCLPLILYYNCYNLDLKNKSDFLSFKLGYHAICQLVLSAPILPFHRRTKNVSLLFEIEINIRFLVLISFCDKIRLPKSIEEYSRYIKDLVDYLKISPIEDAYKECLDNKRFFYNNLLVLFVEDEKEKIFLKAQEKYKKDNCSFYNAFDLQKLSKENVGIKYSDQAFDPVNNILSPIVIDLVYQYYIELLYGYQIKERKSNSKAIFVAPHIELSRDIMEALQCVISTFNENIQRQDRRLPTCVLKETKL